MFDIGFSEVIVLGIVGLLVFGPQQLPRLAYSVGLWVGRLQKAIRNARSELEREFDSEEFRRIMERQEAEIQNLKNILREIKDEQSVDDMLGEIKAHNQRAHQIEKQKPALENKPDEPDTSPKS